MLQALRVRQVLLAPQVLLPKYPSRGKRLRDGIEMAFAQAHAHLAQQTMMQLGSLVPLGLLVATAGGVEFGLAGRRFWALDVWQALATENGFGIVT